MNLFTKTLSPTSSVGTMLSEGMRNASRTKGRTNPKTRAKATASIITNSRKPPASREKGCPRASFGVHARLETLLGEALFGHDRLGYLTRQHNVPAWFPVRSRVARCATAARR